MGVLVERDVPGAMRDGTLLRADVYRPAGPGRHPVLLRRTPYGKAGFEAIARTLAARGYLVAVQDIRGRHASDGEWVWAFAEAAQAIEAHDGHDAVEWAAALPHSSGRVGTWGHSYDAWTSWRLAPEQPPSLRGILAAGITTRLLDVTRGILDVGRRLEWCYAEAADARRRAGTNDGPTDPDVAHAAWTEVERGKWLWFHPLGEIPEQVFSTVTPDLKQYYREVDRELWAFDEIHPRVEVPTCTVTGWWDRFSRGVSSFDGMQRNGPAATRDAHRLVVGPWSHDPDGYTSGFPDLDPGPAAARPFADLVTGFFDPLLKDADDPVAPSERARFFTLGADRWQSAATWPPEDVEERRLFLRSGGRANTTRGDGACRSTRPAASRPTATSTTRATPS
jgi:putative CocE/NonD family hydrolase